MDANLYRAQAATVLALAHAADNAGVRAELLELALRFAQLAEYADRFGTEYGSYWLPGILPGPGKQG